MKIHEEQYVKIDEKQFLDYYFVFKSDLAIFV